MDKLGQALLMNQSILVIPICALIIEIGTLVMFFLWLSSYNKKITKQEELIVSFRDAMFYSSVSNIEEELDTFISNRFDMYLFIEKYNMNRTISSEEECNMYAELHQIVMHSISEAFYTRLCLIYNPDILSDLISQKVMVLVATYCMAVNNPPKQE